jgi:hypothetical protein
MKGVPIALLMLVTTGCLLMTSTVSAANRHHPKKPFGFKSPSSSRHQPRPPRNRSARSHKPRRVKPFGYKPARSQPRHHSR